MNAATRRGQNNEVIGVICVGQDITQINAMAAEQQRIADDLARLIDSANAPIFGVDLKGAGRGSSAGVPFWQSSAKRW